MLTRLQVTGFKNLVNADIRFGPFTCIAGPNAVGKSNLFDAIRFLSLLANEPLLDAALSVRAEEGRTGDIRSLFHRVGNKFDDTMSLKAEMIIPAEGTDDLGQKAEATITLVRYSLEIGYRQDEDRPTLGSLELRCEELEHINIGDAPKALLFPHSAGLWRKSVLKGRRAAPFITTTMQNNARIVKLSQDGTGGRPKSFLAENLPRTVLSTVNATESPTALLVRRELQSWQLLQLEPSALREPDRFTTPPGLQPDGSHLPATLYYLARFFGNHQGNGRGNGRPGKYSWAYDQVASRLSELIEDIREVFIDEDQQRELLSLQIVEKDGTAYPARSLSDGTLRFLALAVLDLDPHASGLVCLEEPENGIHPKRIPAIINLLQDIACDVQNPIGPDNPLRQVIINTHSPVVVGQVPDDSLLIAGLQETVRHNARFNRATFSWLPDTWRSGAEPHTLPVAKGQLLAYLNPSGPQEPSSDFTLPRQRRVIDRQDIKQLALPFSALDA